MSNVVIGKRRRDHPTLETSLDVRQFVDLEAVVDDDEEEEEEDEELGNVCLWWLWILVKCWNLMIVSDDFVIEDEAEDEVALPARSSIPHSDINEIET